MLFMTDCFYLVKDLFIFNLKDRVTVGGKKRSFISLLISQVASIPGADPV